MKYVIIANNRPFVIGRQGENGVTTIRFSINAFFPHLTDATFGLIHQRQGDAAPYPCVITNLGGYINWEINSADVANSGSGTAQLTAYKGNAVAKTVVFTTITLNSMGAVDPPDPQKIWIDEVIYQSNRAIDSAAAAAESAEAAQQALADLEETIDETVSTSLAEAKASGEFDGPQGQRGFGVYGGSNVLIETWTDGTTVEPYSVSKSDVPDVVVGDFIVGVAAGELCVMKVTRENDYLLFGDDVTSTAGPQGEQGPAGEGITDSVKLALLQLAEKVAYIDAQGQIYYDDLYNALYPPALLTGITATFQQGSTVVYDTASLDSLKPMLSVVALYDDGSTAPVVGYTLSGTLTAGMSTITVTYQGKTDTFDVTVTHRVVSMTGIRATFTQGDHTVYDNDELNSLKPYLTVIADYDDGSTETVTAYSLSGTLTVGTSTITVGYSGFSTTFSVTVTQHEAVLTSISAVFTQGDNAIYDTDSLDTLKQYLVVTAAYDDGSTATVASADYTLSGTLTEGTSTITVSYGGKTDTFTVAVSHQTVTIVATWYAYSVETGGSAGRYAQFYQIQVANNKYGGFWANVETNKNYKITVAGKHLNRFRVQLNNTFNPNSISYSAATQEVYPLNQVYALDPNPTDTETLQTFETTVNSGEYTWLVVTCRSNLAYSDTDEYAISCVVEEA